jgi:hypothetical protein
MKLIEIKYFLKQVIYLNENDFDFSLKKKFIEGRFILKIYPT